MLISAENGCTMIIINNILLLFIFYVTNTWAHSPVEPDSNNLKEGDYEVKLLDNNDVYENNLPGSEKVRIKIYYECLCPYCKKFETEDLAKVLDSMGSYLDVQTYPFGNARMVDHNGKIEFKCQHGPAECYGNKLHACALDKLQHTTALRYNICLMDTNQDSTSDDDSADRCGELMIIPSVLIKECAKGDKGNELLRHYGEESKKAHFSYVPYVLINGIVFTGDDFEQAVCDAFTTPPPACE